MASGRPTSPGLPESVPLLVQSPWLLLRRIGLDDDGIEKNPINPSQSIVERKSYGLNTPF